jgi:hypothetical protein
MTTRRRTHYGIHPQHVMFAVTFLPVLALVAYVVARILFSIP